MTKKETKMKNEPNGSPTVIMNVKVQTFLLFL